MTDTKENIVDIKPTQPKPDIYAFVVKKVTENKWEAGAKASSPIHDVGYKNIELDTQEEALAALPDMIAKVESFLNE
jgi:hypothetical protein